MSERGKKLFKLHAASDKFCSSERCSASQNNSPRRILIKYFPPLPGWSATHSNVRQISFHQIMPRLSSQARRRINYGPDAKHPGVQGNALPGVQGNALPGVQGNAPAVGAGQRPGVALLPQDMTRPAPGHIYRLQVTDNIEPLISPKVFFNGIVIAYPLSEQKAKFLPQSKCAGFENERRTDDKESKNNI